MSFAEAVRSCYGKFATFSGRAGRSEYFWFEVFIFLLVVAYGVIYRGLDSGVAMAFVLFVYASFIPWLAVAVRRLHDTGQSGRWLLIALIPWVGPIVLHVMLGLAGDRRPNKYGPPPAPRRFPGVTTIRRVVAPWSFSSQSETETGWSS